MDGCHGCVLVPFLPPLHVHVLAKSLWKTFGIASPVPRDAGEHRGRDMDGVDAYFYLGHGSFPSTKGSWIGSVESGLFSDTTEVDRVRTRFRVGFKPDGKGDETQLRRPRAHSIRTASRRLARVLLDDGACQRSGTSGQEVEGRGERVVKCQTWTKRGGGKAGADRRRTTVILQVTRGLRCGHAFADNWQCEKEEMRENAAKKDGQVAWRCEPGHSSCPPDEGKKDGRGRREGNDNQRRSQSLAGARRGSGFGWVGPDWHVVTPHHGPFGGGKRWNGMPFSSTPSASTDAKKAKKSNNRSSAKKESKKKKNAEDQPSDKPKDENTKEGQDGPGQKDESEDKQESEEKQESIHIKLYNIFKEEIHNIFTATPPAKSRSSVYGGSDAPASDSMDIMKVKQPESAWQKRWGAFKEQAEANPFFQKLQGVKDSSVFVRAREMADDLKDRWETSDNPLVHRIQDFSDSVFGETETAQAVRIIRSRDPDFDSVRFLGTLKKDIPMVLRCYLEGNVEPLKVYCSPEMIERMSGQARVWAAEGAVVDPNILDVADVEMVEVKLFNGEPLVIVQFVAQQINCVRDKFGNVLEGAPDDIQSVYYLWALQQSGEVPETGGAPRWYLREMLVRGMHATI